MEFYFASILALAISAGQLIRIPIASGAINLLDITVIIFTIFGLFKKRIDFKKIPIPFIFFLLFLLSGFFSLIISPLNLTVNEFINSFSYALRLLFYLLFFLTLTSFDIKKNIEKVILISGLAVSILGILQFLFFPDLSFLTQYGWDPHFFRNVSTFLDPNFAGAFFVFILIFIIGSKNISNKLRILFLTLVYISLLITFSRSSYLMFLISGIFFALIKKSLKLFIFVTLFFALLLFGFQKYTEAVAKPRNINREQSASFRLSTWQQGLTIFQTSFVFGVGYNSYRYAIEKYHLADNQFLQSHGSSSNDSSLLTVLATTGVVGFCFYTLFLLTLFKFSWKNKLTLVSIIPGLLIHSLFANSLFYPPILLLLFLGYFIKIEN